MKRYLPLLLVETYLLLTLAIFYFGPIEYKVHNSILFFSLMVIYHCFFIFGYVLACKLKVFTKNVVSERVYSASSYWWLFYFGMIGVWGAYRNIMMMDGIIPYDF